eukprot:244977_1
MSQRLCYRRLCSIISHQRHMNSLRPYYLSHSMFSTNATTLPQSPLYKSYAKIKNLPPQQNQNQSIPSSSTPSPLLSNLKLLDSNHHLLPLDYMQDWSTVRELLNKTLFYYIHDFCDDFAHQHATNSVMSSEFVRRTQYMLLKTNIGGKNNRGISHCASLLALRNHQKKEFTARDLHNALTIAVCIEALQSYFLVLDDVMDDSETRRGQPCWYKYPNVGLKAINDGSIIQSWLNWMISNRLIIDKDQDHDAVLVSRLKSLFEEVTRLTEAGQCIDLETVKDTEQLRTQYTIDRYETIAMYKTSFYTFYLPYAAALYVAGYDDKNGNKRINEELSVEQDDGVLDDGFLFHIVRQLSIEFGIKFQIDDDYLDCYGDPQVTGKVGTDIEDFKCSWLVVQALARMNDEQYVILKEHYGRNDATDVSKVKELFNELGMEEMYKNWETDQHDKLMNMVHECEGILPKEMFTVILDKLHKRNR